jgi:hypothetical protein
MVEQREEHPIPTGLLSYMMLWPHREYVVKVIKAPLQKAIEKAKRLKITSKAFIEAARNFRLKFGMVDNNNSLCWNAKNIIEAKNWFLSYPNMKGRRELISSVLDLYAAELEHDPDYRFTHDLLVDFMLGKILIEGKWDVNNGVPNIRNWPEPPPYSPETSLVGKLIRHRQEILKIIGEKE